MARNPNKRRCTATNRAGKPCGNWAKRGYKVCHYHGAGGGGTKNNKNAVTTGESEYIDFETLTDDEKELISEIEQSRFKLVDDEIKLTDIRLRRMMKRITTLEQGSLTTVKQQYKQDDFLINSKETKRSNLLKIQEIEEAITRLQTQKLRLIEHKHEMTKDIGGYPQI